MAHKIIVEGIKLYGFHGCLQEESKIGTNYTIDIIMETDFLEAAHQDDLTKTIDYVVVYKIVKEQMAIRSKLIEQVGKRITDALKNEFGSFLQNISVKVTKHIPPMNGNVEKVSILIEE